MSIVSRSLELQRYAPGHEVSETGAVSHAMYPHPEGSMTDYAKALEIVDALEAENLIMRRALENIARGLVSQQAAALEAHNALDATGEFPPEDWVQMCEVMRQYEKACAKHRPMASAHEGYAVIREELDELWNEAKTDNLPRALKEASHVAAMGLRFLVDLSPRAKRP